MKFQADITEADYGTHIVNTLGPQRVVLERGTAMLYGGVPRGMLCTAHITDLSVSDARRVARADGALKRALMDHHREWGLPQRPAPETVWKDAMIRGFVAGGDWAAWLRCEIDPDGVQVLREDGEPGTANDLTVPTTRCSAITLEFRGILAVTGYHAHYKCLGPVITHVTVHPNPPMPRVERILVGWAVMGRQGSIANVDAVQLERGYLSCFADRWLEGDVTSGMASVGGITVGSLNYFTDGNTFVCEGSAEAVRAMCLPRLAHGVHFTHFKPYAPQHTDVANTAFRSGPLVVSTDDRPLGSRVFPINSLQRVSPWMVERERELSKLEYVRFTQRWWTLPHHHHLKVNLTVPLLLLVDRRLRNTERQTLPLPVWFVVFSFFRFELRAPPRLM